MTPIQFAEKSAVQRHGELLEAIADKGFPCLGAKSAMARGLLKTLVCKSLACPSDDLRIHSELVKWAKAYRRDPKGLRSLAVIFEHPSLLSEERFEKLLWKRLQSLAEEDAARGQPYDLSVSSDPSDPKFSLSFGGAAFFVIGMHPNASRPARRVPRPTLIFNLHDQFVRLRRDGNYESMREKIILRDLALSGSTNPMLARFGEATSARQYSGRAVEDDWLCPFRRPGEQ